MTETKQQRDRYDFWTRSFQPGLLWRAMGRRETRFGPEVSHTDFNHALCPRLPSVFWGHRLTMGEAKGTAESIGAAIQRIFWNYPEGGIILDALYTPAGGGRMEMNCGGSWTHPALSDALRTLPRPGLQRIYLTIDPSRATPDEIISWPCNITLAPTSMKDAAAKNVTTQSLAAAWDWIAALLSRTWRNALLLSPFPAGVAEHPIEVRGTYPAWRASGVRPSEPGRNAVITTHCPGRYLAALSNEQQASPDPPFPLDGGAGVIVDAHLPISQSLHNMLTEREKAYRELGAVIEHKEAEEKTPC